VTLNPEWWATLHGTMPRRNHHPDGRGRPLGASDADGSAHDREAERSKDGRS